MHAWQGYVVRIRCCEVQRGGRLVSTEEGTEEGSANGIETLRRSGNVRQGCCGVEARPRRACARCQQRASTGFYGDRLAPKMNAAAVSRSNRGAIAMPSFTRVSLDTGDSREPQTVTPCVRADRIWVAQSAFREHGGECGID